MKNHFWEAALIVELFALFIMWIIYSGGKP